MKGTAAEMKKFNEGVKESISNAIEQAKTPEKKEELIALLKMNLFKALDQLVANIEAMELAMKSTRSNHKQHEYKTNTGGEGI